MGKERGVQRHGVGSGPDNHDVFQLMHGELGDGSITGLFHCFHEQLICLHSSVFRRHVIGGIEVERIHLTELHELQDFHDARGGRLDLVEFLFAEQDILILFVFVALHNFRPFDVSIANGTKQWLLETRMALFVELVETDSFAAGRSRHADGHRNQAKRELAFPDGRGHIDTPSTTALPPCRIFLRSAAHWARSKMHPCPVMLNLQSKPRSSVLYSSKAPYTSLMLIPPLTKRSLASAANRFFSWSEMTKSNARSNTSSIWSMAGSK